MEYTMTSLAELLFGIDGEPTGMIPVDPFDVVAPAAAKIFNAKAAPTPIEIIYNAPVAEKQDEPVE